MPDETNWAPLRDFAAQFIDAVDDRHAPDIVMGALAGQLQRALNREFPPAGYIIAGPDELQYYAEQLILHHAYDIDTSYIQEASTFFLGRDLTDEEFDKVGSLLDLVNVIVEFRGDND